MEFLTPQLLVLVPIVIGLVQAIKMLGVDSKYAPSIAVLLGIGGALAIGGFSWLVVLGGAVVGLTSVGLFSGTRASIQ